MSTPQTGQIVANGIMQAYTRWPAPPGARRLPVVLLHGVLQAGEGMRHLAETLSRSGEVIVPDLRGRGGTEQPDDGYDPATMAADVAALLDALDVGPVVLIGRKHGGVVAYHLAAARPDLVAGVVMGDTSPEINDARATRVQERMAALPREFANQEDAERFYEYGLRLPMARARSDVPVDLEAGDDGRLHWRHNLDLVARIEAACQPRDDWAMLERVQCPVVMLRGHRGEITPEIAARMSALPNGARVQLVHGSRHDVFIGPGAEQSLAAISLLLRETAPR
ncbi:MAG: alpha/beta hydrolase [Thermomicrobiales bacterium]